MEKGGKWEEDSLEVRRSRVGNEGSSNSIESSSAATASEEEEDIAQLKGNGHMIYPSESVTVDDDYVRQESESESSVLDESKEKEKDGPEDLLLAPVVGNGGIRKETEITEEGESQAKSNNSVYFDLNEGRFPFFLISLLLFKPVVISYDISLFHINGILFTYILSLSLSLSICLSLSVM